MSARTYPTLQAVPTFADDSEAVVECLQSIQRELAEAFADARRMRRIDLLLEIAATLTLVADAARTDWTGNGTLIGQPRDPARIPPLLQELDVKPTALVALGGAEIEAAKRAVELVSSPTSLETVVVEAMDEIKSTLATA